MEKCRWCDKTGSWPAICKSTRDMEDKPHDPVCDAMLLRLGGGERIVNQERARHALNYDGEDINSLTVGEIRRALP